MPTLLVVHHTPSPAMQAMLEAVTAGAKDDAIEGIDVVVRPALGATASDLLAADGVVLGTPANMGYMSGALKHFFDNVFYPTLSALEGFPYGYYVHGDNDVAGAERAIKKITGGMGWRQVAAPVLITGPVDRTAREACAELGATVASVLMP